MWFLPSQVFEKVSKVLLWMRLLASFCKTVRNSLLRLDLVCLGSVAKLLQPKSFAQGFPASICPTNCTSAKANETMRLCGTTWRYFIYSSEYATTPPCNIKAKNPSTTTRQRFCLQGRGSKQIHNLLTGAGSWLPIVFFGSRILEKLFCAFYHSESFQKSSCGCVFPFGFLL